MRVLNASFLAGVGALLIFSAPVCAHHGYAAYDMTVVESRKATITEFQLINPHSLVMFDVLDSGGNSQHWYVEWGTVRAMKTDGIAPDSLKPGDEVTIYFHPAKDGKFGGVLIKVEFPDGRVLPSQPHNRGHREEIPNLRQGAIL